MSMQSLTKDIAKVFGSPSFGFSAQPPSRASVVKNSAAPPPVKNSAAPPPRGPPAPKPGLAPAPMLAPPFAPMMGNMPIMSTPTMSRLPLPAPKPGLASAPMLAPSFAPMMGNMPIMSTPTMSRLPLPSHMGYAMHVGGGHPPVNTHLLFNKPVAFQTVNTYKHVDPSGGEEL